MTAHTVAHMFVHALRRYPERPFLRWIDGNGERALTYAEAARMVAGIVETLRGRGVSRGDFVVVATEDIRRTILFDVGCAVAGAVHVPAIPPTPQTVDGLMRRVGAKAVFATGHDAAQLIADGVCPLVLDEAMAGAEEIRPLAPSDERIAEMIATAADALDSESLYMLQPTSGTTNEPKLVMRPHRVFVRVARLLSFDLSEAGAERMLMVAALTHGFGQYNLATGLSLAVTFVVPSGVDTESSLEEVRRLDPTYIGVTPRVLRSYVQQHGGTGAGGTVFGAAAKLLLTGGSRKDPELLRYIESHAVRVAEGYGAAEFSLVAIAEPGTWKPDVIGRIQSDVTLKIGSDGQLLAKSPNGIMLGYFGDPERTRAAFDEDGFYKTGDKCAITDAGELTYQGRTIDVFNIHGGVNVSPALAEHELERLPWVQQALLLGEQRPWVGALLVPIDEIARDPAARRAMADVVRRDVGRINELVDPSARVRTVYLLAQPFAEDIYRIVGHGKVSRLRDAAARALAAETAELYKASPDTIEIPGAAHERRRAARSAVAWLARVQAGDATACGYTRNVGGGGALIEANLASPVGTDCSVTLFLPGKAITLAARIARRAEGGIALEFFDPRASRDLKDAMTRSAHG